MSRTDPTIESKARQTIREFLDRKRRGAGGNRVYLVSYPRSGNTLAREYLAILQGRPQLSVYDGDVVNLTDVALTQALDHVDIVKSHQMPPDDGPMIYLVRDGRNATLSFLYMAFLFGGHRFSRLNEVYDGIRHLDEAEGCWADHVAQALRLSESRQTLFVRHEDLVRDPAATLARMARFMAAEISGETLGECVRRRAASSTYTANPNNGYLYEPEQGSIYDVLKRHRSGDYWRHIFDGRSKRYFHERGGTQWLRRFGYESAADWWKQ
ncbi:MAG: sulfotransferase domain-containing protein [Xanthobacteraceae bacterium]